MLIAASRHASNFLLYKRRMPLIFTFDMLPRYRRASADAIFSILRAHAEYREEMQTLMIEILHCDFDGHIFALIPARPATGQRAARRRSYHGAGSAPRCALRGSAARSRRRRVPRGVMVSGIAAAFCSLLAKFYRCSFAFPAAAKGLS